VSYLTVNEIEDIIKKLLSNKDERKICLSFFLEAIKKANSCGSNKWGVYCCKDKVRLLVGSLIVFTINKDKIWLTLDKQALNGNNDKMKLLEDSKLWNWENGDYSEYIPVPSMNGYYTPSIANLDILPVICDLHFIYIEKVAQRYQLLMSTSQSKHSGELLKYLEKELGQIVPSPNYTTESDVNSFQDIEEIEQDVNIFQDIEEFKISNRELPETAREAIVQSRIGQGTFRNDLKKYWRKCAITGCEFTEILKASHIKPWRDSDNAERLDVYNGLLLTPNLDSAFDKGYISFDNEGKIIISSLLRENDKSKLGINSEMRIGKLEQNHIKYLEYHRQNIFGKFKH